MKLLIRNLARTTTEASLRKLFEAHGTVQFCNLVIDAESGKSKGFGFIQMPKNGEAKVAIKSLNDSDLDGSKIRVKKAEEKKVKSAESKDAENKNERNKNVWNRS